MAKVLMEMFTQVLGSYTYIYEDDHDINPTFIYDEDDGESTDINVHPGAGGGVTLALLSCVRPHT